MTTPMHRVATILLTLLFVSSLAVAASGCWYSKGKEGYICKSSKDCKGKLRCRTFRGGGKTRRACVSASTRSISSNSTYTKWAVYMSWGFLFSLPVAGAAIFVVARRNRQRAAAAPASGQPPVAPPPPDEPPAAV